jgi:hypothetical protein
MGQVLHRGATTTEAIRRAIQRSQESLRALACGHGINPKTVAKWRKRDSVADLPTGPRTLRSTVLSVEEEVVIVAFRRHTLEGKLYLFVAIDRTSKFVFVELVERATTEIASAFLSALIQAVPIASTRC